MAQGSFSDQPGVKYDGKKYLGEGAPSKSGEGNKSTTTLPAIGSSNAGTNKGATAPYFGERKK